MEIDDKILSFTDSSNEDVLRSAMSILLATRYRNVEQVFGLMVEGYSTAGSDSERKVVVDAMKEYSRFDLDVWRQAGPEIQRQIMALIDNLPTDLRAAVTPALGELWTQFLATEMSSTALTAMDTVTISRAAVSATPDLASLRTRALAGILEQFANAQTPVDRRSWYGRGHDALRLPHRGEYTDALAALILENTLTFIATVKAKINELEFELVEEIDEDMLWLYRRSQQLAQDATDGSLKQAASEAAEAAFSLHEVLDSNREYVLYKTLVGFRGTFPGDWTSNSFDYAAKEQHRLAEIEKLVAAIGPESTADWIVRIERCAGADSRDMATFPMFGNFLRKLSRDKPEVAVSIFEALSESAKRFLPAFLAGLAASGNSHAYESVLSKYRQQLEHLAAVAMHYRSVPLNIELAREALDLAIAHKQAIAAIEILTLAVENYEKPNVTDTLFDPALDFLVSENDGRWVQTTSYLAVAKGFFSALAHPLRSKVLASLAGLDELNYGAERILSWISEAHPEEIWQFINGRFRAPDEVKRGDYEPVPYSLSELRDGLAKRPAEAVASVRSLYDPEVGYFRFELGRVLAEVFKSLPDEFVAALRSLIFANSDHDIDFVLDTLTNYDGNIGIHPLLRDIAAVRADDEERLRGVRRAIEATGVVTGQFGFVEAYRSKLEAMDNWMADERPAVRSFAVAMAKELERMIAWEQQRAEQEQEMRKREFDNRRNRKSRAEDDDPSSS